MQTIKAQPLIRQEQYPSSSMITLNKCNKNDVVSIYNITGKQIHQAKLNENKSLNIDYLVAGIYFVKVLSKKGLQINKGVK